MTVSKVRLQSLLLLNFILMFVKKKRKKGSFEMRSLKKDKLPKEA